MNILNIVSAVLVVGGVGLLFGLLLAFAAHVFAVKKDERVEKILECLPGANCGSCGYAGCNAFAEAAAGGNAPVNGCTVGKAPVAEAIAAIMGVQAEEVKEYSARVMCDGDCTAAPDKFTYSGVMDCRAAERYAGGAKKCENGCLGLGSCVSVCEFGAISIKNGIAVVDDKLCAACGKCVSVCPKHLIKLVPKTARHWVTCSNHQKGKAVTDACQKGCIACKICEKNCNFDAVHVEDNCAVIDYERCRNCGACAVKCPRKIIHAQPKEM